MKRGEIWWTDLPEPVGSMPGYRRPVLIVQADSFTDSLIRTAIVVVLTSNLHLANAPGNVLLPNRSTGLTKDCVVNVTQLLTVDKSLFTERIGRLNNRYVTLVEEGLRLALDL